MKNFLKKLEQKKNRIILLTYTTLLSAFCLSAAPAFATSSGSGAGGLTTAVQSTWETALEQIKTIVNTVVFPIIDAVLLILLFVKVGTAYFDYRKSGHFEFTAPAIIFACLIFTLTAPLYIWQIIG